MRYFTCVNIDSILFSIEPLWRGLISALSSFAGSRHSIAFPFALDTNTKLLHHSDMSEMLVGLSLAAFVASAALSLGDPANYMLIFLEAPNIVYCLL